MRVFLLIAALTVVSGCFPPDTFGDMWSQLDAIEVPDDFTLVGKSQYGSRSGFMGSGAPEAINRYSAPWDEGELCGRLRDLAQTYGEVIDSSSGTCGFQTTIPSGWSAWILGVSSYRLDISAIPPEMLAKKREGDDCEAIRARDQAEKPDGYFGRYVPCWIAPGEARATTRLLGSRF